MSTPSNATEQTVRSFLQALGRNDWDAAREFMSDDVKWTVVEAGIPGSGDHIGPDAVIRTMAAIKRKFEPGSPVMSITAIVATETTMFLEALGGGRLRDGRPFDTKYVFVFEVRDNRVCEFREYMDSLYINALMGSEI